MQLSELVADAKDRIAETSTSFFSDSTWKRWLNEAQRAVVRQTKILEYSATTPTVASQRGYTMAAEFWMPRLVKYENDIIYPISVDVLENGFTTTGTPTNYAVWGKTLLLYPTPSAVGTLLVYYYAWPSTMSDDGDVPDIPEAFHGLLPTFAAYRAKQADQQPGEANLLSQEFQQGVYELLGAYADQQDHHNQVVDVYGYDGMSF